MLEKNCDHTPHHGPLVPSLKEDEFDNTKFLGEPQWMTNAIEDLKSPVYTWRKVPRRLYLCTLPLSLLLRAGALMALIGAWLVLSCVGFTMNLAYCKWHGQPNLWE